MAVETRFVVIRGGNEIMTFADKKAADEYDRMLDMADNLTALFENSAIDLDDKLKEDLGIYMAKNRDEVLYALMAKKRPPAEKPRTAAKPQAAVKTNTKATKEPEEPANKEAAANDETPTKPTRKRKAAAS